jgi:hypothetical protein
MSNNGRGKSNRDMMTTLEFDDGKTMECEMEGVFDAGGRDYIALLPQDDSGDVYIYRYLEDKDGDYYFEDETDEKRFAEAVREYEAFKGYQRTEEKS